VVIACSDPIDRDIYMRGQGEDRIRVYAQVPGGHSFFEPHVPRT
jgi:hypothetical protein